MNRSVYIILSAVLILLFCGFLYDQFGRTDAVPEISQAEKTSVKNGSVRTLDNFGKLKTEVNYRNGVKHGISYLYYPDGETIQLEIPYRNGKRQGVSKKYFRTGKLYAETSYEDNKIHGIRKIYYRKGQLKAEVPYGLGFPGIGLKEYLADGDLKEMPRITYFQKSNLLYFETSQSCTDTKFYIGSLIEGRFLDELSDTIRMLPEIDNQYVADLNIFTPSFLKYQDIICSCKTTQGNLLILRESIDTSSLKKVN
ncbi:MAG: hypothetical protein RIM99_13300 [Cyclobacteriaceae bacterium]